MSRYLKNYQHYIDHYDIYTIKQCLSCYLEIKNGLEKERNTEKFKEFSKEEFDEQVRKTYYNMINAIKTKRYKYKKETIEKWMAQDRKDQEKFDNAIPSSEVLCKDCSSSTKIISKDLHDLDKEDSQVLFIFECLNCKKRQAFYEDGREWHYKKRRCPECNYELDENSNFDKNILTIISTCSNCGYKKEEIDDFDKSEKERKEREDSDKKLLSEFREEFCLDEESGKEMLRFIETVSSIVEKFEEDEKKNKDPLIQKARQLKKLSVMQLEKLIESNIKKDGYKDLSFGKPEIGKYVIINFSIIETNDYRDEYDSQNTLKKIIGKLLEDTNWRLMSNGINYRLGILTGRLKAYESEEDLVKILKKRKKK